jgi:hypothetical protein
LTAASPQVSLASTSPTTSSFRLVPTYGPMKYKAAFRELCVAQRCRHLLGDLSDPRAPRVADALEWRSRSVPAFQLCLQARAPPRGATRSVESDKLPLS